MDNNLVLVPDQDYKVLIKCLTYNQEKYIEDALKGFVRQKTNFPYCALVVDDCSTDGTTEIIKQYEARYPEIIKGIYLPVNMYGNPEKRKYIKPWEERAQYIAKCEGDDYWIDDYKLQNQVDFLDAHPDYMMHFHNAIVRFENHNHPDRLISNFQSGDFDTELLFKKWQLPLASVLFRKELCYSDVYQELQEVHKGGFPLFIAASIIGKVFGLSECLSVYRKNEGGVSNRMSLSYCMDINYSYAIASKDKNSVRVINRQALKVMGDSFILWLFGNKDAIELKKVIDKYDKAVFYKAMFYQPYYLSKMLLCKIRAIFHLI